MMAATGRMTCGMCARTFDEERGQPSCQACPLSSGCRFVRCPHCGYENPVEPAWLLRLRRVLRLDEPR
jgi:rubredoxin